MSDRRLGVALAQRSPKDDECGLYTCPAYHSVSVTTKVSENISKVRNKQGTAAAQQQVTAHTTLSAPIRLTQDSFR